jgi:hypothetical protein
MLYYIHAVGPCRFVRPEITNDLNCECDVSNQGFSLFTDFADDFGIVF